MKKKLLLHVLLLVVMHSSLFAADYYCDPVSGSMSNPGTSAAPWKRLEDVFAAGKTFSSGDVIYLRNGFHGAPAITGHHSTGYVTIQPQPGHYPGVKWLTVNAASRWVIAGLTISPQLVGEYYNVSKVLIDIEANCSYITVRNNLLYSALNIKGWSKPDLTAKLAFGINCKAPNSLITGNHIKNIGFGIMLEKPAHYTVVSHNLIEYIVNDAMRGLSNYSKWEYNVIENIMQIDDNHDDFFQSWSLGPTGTVGAGVVYGIEVRGNIFISQSDPHLDYPGEDVQGVGLYDGMFEGFIIENNVISVNAYHGITLAGATNCVITNNTVTQPYYRPTGGGIPNRIPWIMVVKHKNGVQLSTGNLVRNNIAGVYTLDNNIGTVDHNLESQALSDLFVDYISSNFRLKNGSAAINAGSDNGVNPLDIELHNRVSPFDQGAYEYNSSSNDGTAPSAPTGITADSISARAFMLRWTPSTDNVGVVRYEIYRDGVLHTKTAQVNVAAVDRLAKETTYSFTIKAIDAAGNVSSASVPLSVTTTGDNVPPAVPSIVNVVSLNTTSFTVSWKKSTDNELVHGYEIYVDGSLAQFVAGTTVHHLTNLNPGQTYAVTVRAKDIFNNYSALTTPLHVTTPTNPNYSVFTTLEPAGLTQTDEVELGMKFKSSQGGLIRKIRYYKPEGDNAVHTGHIWKKDGIELASVVFTNETTFGWQEATLATPVSLRANDTVIVSVNSSFQYYYTSLGLETQKTNGPLSSIVPVDGSNGVYNIIKGQFPVSSYNKTNYFRDIVFTPGGNDETAPSIPTGLTAGALPTSSVSISWNASTDNVGVFKYDVHKNGVLAASIPGTSITLTGLAPSTAYVITVKARDVADNISTASAPLTVNTLAYYTALTTQSPAFTGTDGPHELGMKFKSSVNSQIVKIRFYKKEHDTLTNQVHTGRIWNKNGIQLAAVEFVNETDSGWQEIALPTPLDIKADSVYVVSVNTLRNYASTIGGLTDAITNGPLSTIAGDPGQNGVVGIPGQFPTGDFGHSNYFRDVTIIPWPSDTIPPSPPTNLAASNYNNTSFTISWNAGSDNVAVTGYKVYRDGVLAATVSGTSANMTGLTASTTYAITVKSFDAIGNLSVASQTLNVTTSATPATYTVFTTQPPPQNSYTDQNELGMKFIATQAGQVTRIRFYKVSGDNGAHTGRLWSSSGSLLASVSFTNETAEGWQEAVLGTPYTIDANTVYVVSVNTGGRYGAEAGQLTNAIINGPLSSVAGSNGVYGPVNTPATMPSTVSPSGANYFRDIEFRPFNGQNLSAPSNNVTNTTVTVPEGVTEKLKVYPNPVRSNSGFTIDAGTAFQMAAVDVIDLSGRIVLRKQRISAARIINIHQSLKRGVYFVKIHINNKVITSKLIVN